MNENEEQKFEEKVDQYRSKNGNDKLNNEGELLEDKDFEFMREKIKERPVNRKRLVRKTIVTATMAVIFGLIACVTFLILEPVFSNWLYPEEEPKQVTFPEVEEEMLPEDMLQSEIQIPFNENKPNSEGESEDGTKEEEFTLEIEDYQTLYNKLYAVAKECEKSLVTVTAVTSGVDWFNNTYENKGQTSGLILVDDGKELLILADNETVNEAEVIQVTFCDGEQATGQIRATDATIGFSIISVPLTDMGEDTKDAIKIAELGSSNSMNLTGSAIIAMGTPMGTSNSIAYGMLTSVENEISVTDNVYKLITTDIYGSQSAGGTIVDMSGKVIGIIDMNYNSEDTKNLISAIGITELKKTIEKLSNGQQMAYLGIQAIDVTVEANLQMGVPFGAYVTEISMDSPAMQSGIQSGDIIVKMGNQKIENMSQYVDAILPYGPQDEMKVTVMRQGKDEYREMSFTVTLGTLK